MDTALANDLSIKYFGHPMTKRVTVDPLTDESIDYAELIADVVTSPQHGYSRFHIGHHKPSQQPKHLPGNVRWQFKASNDFQSTMDVRVARIAYRINEYVDTGQESLLEEALDALDTLRKGQAEDFDAP